MATILSNRANASTSPDMNASRGGDKRKANWIPDDKVTNCLDCGQTFSFSLRKHHCRSCGQIFCWECSEKKIDLSKLGYTGPQRVCNACFAAFEKDSRTLDDALATVQLLLRDVQYFSFHEGLFSMGRRGPPAKLFSGVKVPGNRDEVFCFEVINMNEEFAPIFKLDATRKMFSSLLKETISHPYIAEVIFAQLYEKKVAVCRHFYPSGSLRDFIHGKVNPKLNYIEKYQNPGTPMPIHLIKRLGKQILDALFYLYLHGFPFPHLHAGNVLINGENVCLTDLENSLVGATPFYSLHMMENKQILAPEVLCFGQLLFEMATGFDRAPEQKIGSVKDKCPSDLYPLLELIFEAKDPQTAPTIKTLLKHPFFAGAASEVKIHKSVLAEEWDEKVRSALKAVRHMTPKAINPNAQVTMKRTPSVANVDSIAARKSSTGLVASSSGSNLAVTSPVTSPRATSPPPPTRATSPPPPTRATSPPLPTTATSSKPKASTSAAPAPPPPPPPAPTKSAAVAASVPPPQEGRNALLDSIRNPNPLSRLKKTAPPKK